MTYTTPFTARFPGPCADERCETPIKGGDEIMRADGGGYVHVVCPDPLPLPLDRPGKFDGTDDESMGF